MIIQSKTLIALAIAALLIGAIVLIVTAVLVRAVTGIDMCSLASGYAPSPDGEPKQNQTYDGLYRLTKHIGEQRNDLAMCLGYALGSAALLVGAVLLAWWVDRERLQRLSGAPKRPEAS